MVFHRAIAGNPIPLAIGSRDSQINPTNTATPIEVVMIRIILSAAIVFCFALPAEAQLICPPGQQCPPGQFYCPPPVYISGPVEPSIADEVLANWYVKFTGVDRQASSATAEEKALASLVRASVRCYQGNGCGTGTLNGRDENYIYILTNAHVASTRIGTAVKCQSGAGEAMEEFTGTVIETGYSNQYRTDWSLLRADAKYLKGIKPVQLSKAKPNPNATTITWGHPKCNPTEGHACKTVRMETVWLWNPNAIGGQSGSAVVQLEDGVPVQKGLLTWSEGGYGSGQFASTIWQQSSERTVVGEMRTGNEELPKVNTGAVELVEGYNDFELTEGWKCLGDAREVALRDYPIWHEPGTGPVDPPPVDPPADCPPMSPEVREKLEAIQKALGETLDIK